MRRLFVLVLVCACSVIAPRTSVYGFEIFNRWTTTATDGFIGSQAASQGVPTTVTWSLVDDGTFINSVNFGGGSSTDAGPSDFISFLDSEFGAGPGGSDYTLRPWFIYFEDSFSRLSSLSGVSYVYQPNDDGPTIGTASGNSVRGDVRIGGNSFGSSVGGTLAYNSFPNNGDMVFNTDRTDLGSTTNNARFLRNTIMHEAMHGLGFEHVESSNASFLIEPTLNTSFDGPQHDDILGMQRSYGDVLEKNGGNDTSGTATSLGIVNTSTVASVGTSGSGTSVGPAETDFVSIDDDGDQDYFRFTVTETADIRLDLVPRGAVYQVGPEGGTQSSFDSRALSNLGLTLFASNGVTQLANSNSAAAGQSETITTELTPGDYFARVTGTNNNVQLYQLSIFTSRDPLDLTWTGQVSSVWSTNGDANFSSTSGAIAFANLDNVRFDDTSPLNRRTVEVNGLVNADAIVFDASGDYTITGGGAISGGSVILNGTGTVVIESDGNSYSGPTQINSGTLKLTGNLSAMQSAITVANGGTLVMNASLAGAMSSTFEIQSGGELHVGDQGVSTNADTFPNAPTSVVNNGTIRIFDFEAVRNVSGSGTVIAEELTAFLGGGSTYTGQTIVRSGAIAIAEDSTALGSAVGNTVIERDGTFQVEAGATLADDLEFSNTGSGSTNSLLLVEQGVVANFTGDVTIAAATTIQNEDSAITNFSGSVNSTSGIGEVLLSPVGTVNFNGPLQLGSGGLRMSQAGTLNITSTLSSQGPVRLEAGATTLSGSGTISGIVEVNAGASLTLTGTHSWQSGSTLAGNGTVNGNLTTNGRIAPGDADLTDSIASLSLSDNLTLTSTSELIFEIGGTTVGQFDQLLVDGTAMLDGTLTVELVDLGGGVYDPQLGDSFALLSVDGGAGGVFDTLNLPDLGAGLDWEINPGGIAVSLNVVSAATIAADFDNSGTVDGIDLGIWNSGYGDNLNVIRTDGDANENGVVDGSDFLLWQRQFTGSSPSSLAAVPEPSTAILALFALTFANRRSRLSYFG
ncbi:MAG: pre-peptidase C-terminal domain-containing protein [Lacipirellulaceae bacterium]